MDILTMDKSDFAEIEVQSPTGEFNGFVIVPTDDMHDSGFRCMKYVLLNGNTIVGCVGGYCDVIHLNGIGGYGKYEGNGSDWQAAVVSGKVDVVPWNIDCLPCGLVRIFVNGPNRVLSLDSIICSDFSVYA